MTADNKESQKPEDISHKNKDVTENLCNVTQKDGDNKAPSDRFINDLKRKIKILEQQKQFHIQEHDKLQSRLEKCERLLREAQKEILKPTGIPISKLGHDLDEYFAEVEK